MKLIRVVFFILNIGLAACEQQNKEVVQISVDPRAKALNDSAVAVGQYYEKEEASEAIQLLNQAIQIDSNYYLAYWNKFGFQTRLKDQHGAIVTAKQLLRLKPNSPDLHGAVAVMYEMNGDSVTAKQHLQRAQILYDQVLDTLETDSRQHDVLVMSKGINLILLGKEKEGNQLLRQLHKNQTDSNFKEMISEFMDKDRKQLLKIMVFNK